MLKDTILSTLSGSPSFCVGCTACAHACPASAISMKEDAEGFLSPVVDESLCTGCGLCRKV
ncbi:MAG: 4Fe-4S binding protein, partial [Mailhella sp.]|nr:4Fe-4S binding protein [Mailhella sp.]